MEEHFTETEIKIAKIIVGPHNALPEEVKTTLQELRDLRWKRSDPEVKGIALNGARALLKECKIAFSSKTKNKE